MAHDDLVTVYTVSNPMQAEIIKNALETEGLRCFIEGELQAAESGLGGIPIKIQVPANEAERAARFIKKHEHHG
jgi:hypothetical protein